MPSSQAAKARFENIQRQTAGGPGGSTAWGDISGTLSDQTDLQAALDGKETAGAAAAAQAAAEAYADGLVVGLWDDRGNFDASVNAYPSSGGSGTAGAILKGDIWTISVAGTLPTGQVVEPGDTVRALADTPGNTQANWSVTQNNIGYTPASAAALTAEETARKLADAPWAIAGGTADAMTATLMSVPSYQDGRLLRVRAVGANTITTPTLDVNGLGPAIIKKKGNQVLAAGDIASSTHELLLTVRDEGVSGVFLELANPATDADSYTDEKAQDAVAAMIAAGTHSGISFSYNDAGNAMSATVSGGSSAVDCVQKTVSASAHGHQVGNIVAKSSSAYPKADRDDAALTAHAMVSAIAAPGTPGDPYFASVVLLLHGDGTNGQTSITDSSTSAKTMTAGNQAQLSTAQKKFGTASMLFDSSGDYFSTPNHADFNFGTGDFTVEAWVYLNNTGDNVIATTYQNTTNGWSFQTYLGKLIFNCTGDGPDITSTTTPVTGQWYHVAVSRSGTTMRMYIDGSLEATVTDSQNITSTAPLYVGLGTPTYPATSWDGYIDDLRITKGVARYTGTGFSVPSAAFPDVYGTGASNSFTAVTFGKVTLTTGEWDAITGDSGGLTTGDFYYLSATAGGMTKTAPTTGLRQLVGQAMSSNEFHFFAGEVVDLGTGSYTSLSTQTASLSVDTTLTTTAETTLLSLSLPAGTWIAFADATMDGSASAQTPDFYITDNTNYWASCTQTCGVTGQIDSVSMTSESFTLSATTTVRFNCKPQTTGSLVFKASSFRAAKPKATRLTAMRVG